MLGALALVPAAHARTDDPWQLSLDWPVNGTLTSPYGHDGGRWHSGLDIGILQDLEVRAAVRGRVVQVGAPRGYEGYGNVVIVQVTPRFSTLYAHLTRALVRPGQYVVEGQPIAVAGCTGWCTGTHLHFELREAGTPVDPTRFVTR